MRAKKSILPILIVLVIFASSLVLMFSFGTFASEQIEDVVDANENAVDLDQSDKQVADIQEQQELSNTTINNQINETDKNPTNDDLPEHLKILKTDGSEAIQDTDYIYPNYDGSLLILGNDVVITSDDPNAEIPVHVKTQDFDDVKNLTLRNINLTSEESTIYIDYGSVSKVKLSEWFLLNIEGNCVITTTNGGAYKYPISFTASAYNTVSDGIKIFGKSSANLTLNNTNSSSIYSNSSIEIGGSININAKRGFWNSPIIANNVKDTAGDLIIQDSANVTLVNDYDSNTRKSSIVIKGSLTLKDNAKLITTSTNYDDSIIIETGDFSILDNASWSSTTSYYDAYNVRLGGNFYEDTTGSVVLNGTSKFNIFAESGQIIIKKGSLINNQTNGEVHIGLQAAKGITIETSDPVRLDTKAMALYTPGNNLDDFVEISGSDVELHSTNGGEDCTIVSNNVYLINDTAVKITSENTAAIQTNNLIIQTEKASILGNYMKKYGALKLLNASAIQSKGYELYGSATKDGEEVTGLIKVLPLSDDADVYSIFIDTDYNEILPAEKLTFKYVGEPDVPPSEDIDFITSQTGDTVSIQLIAILLLLLIGSSTYLIRKNIY